MSSKSQTPGAFRYTGRTNDLQMRLSKHRRDHALVSYADYLEQGVPVLMSTGEMLLPGGPYTHAFWIYDLLARDASPDMEIVERVQDSPLVIEREM